MKKFGYIILGIVLFTYSHTFVEASTISCNEKNGYQLYICRVKTVCEDYKPKPIFFQPTEYQNYDSDSKEYKKEQEKKRKDQNFIENTGDTLAKIINNGDDLEIAKNVYKQNMNTIYKCALLGVQQKSYMTLEELVKNNPYLLSKVQKKITSQTSRIARISDTFGCKQKQNNDNNSIQKLAVLKQASHELCKYNSYLEYLKERNKRIQNITPTDKKKYNISTIVQLEREKLVKIDNEIQRAYKIFPIAYHAYSEYENNFSIHTLLELIREDFIAFRKNYHKTINPINQVGYKIINAMKK